MVIHEGIGDIAEGILFSPFEKTKISLEVFCPHPEIEDDIETLIKQNEIRSGFSELDYNLAYYKYVKGWSDDELIKYTRNFKLIPENGIKAKLSFISDEIWAPYALVYQGKRLIIEKIGNNPTPDQFRDLIINQIIPSDLR
ncbi:MAG: hypothetical protein ACFFE4_19695 [Candidatus Thorarchaeota archaeon]